MMRKRNRRQTNLRTKRSNINVPKDIKKNNGCKATQKKAVHSNNEVFYVIGELTTFDAQLIAKKYRVEVVFFAKLVY